MKRILLGLAVLAVSMTAQAQNVSLNCIGLHDTAFTAASARDRDVPLALVQEIIDNDKTIPAFFKKLMGNAALYAYSLPNESPRIVAGDVLRMCLLRTSKQ